MTFTDPPHNIGYEYDAYDDGKKKGWKNVFNDKLTKEDYENFLYKTMKNIFDFSVDKAPLFMWNGWNFLDSIVNAGNKNNYKLNQLCFWIKDRFVFSPGNL